MSYSQRDRTKGGGVGGWSVLENEQGRTRGSGGSKLGNLERTYFLNVPLLFCIKGFNSS